MPTGSLNAVLPALSVSLVGTYEGTTPTDTSNALEGLDLLLTASVTFAVPVPAAPPAAGAKYDVAVAYPIPTMVDGIPT